MCKASKPWYTHWSQLDTQTHRPYMCFFNTDMCVCTYVYGSEVQKQTHTFFLIPLGQQCEFITQVRHYHTTLPLASTIKGAWAACHTSRAFLNFFFNLCLFKPSLWKLWTLTVWKVSEHGKRKRVVASSLNTTSEALFAATVISTSCVPNAHRMRQHQYTVSQPEHLRSKGGGTGQMFVRLSLCA